MSKETGSFSEISLDLENLPRLRLEQNQKQSNPTEADVRESLTPGAESSTWLTVSSQQTKAEIKTSICNLNMILWIVFGSLFMMLIASTITFGILTFQNKKQLPEEDVGWQFWTPYVGDSQRLVLTTVLNSKKNAVAIKQHLEARASDTGKLLSEMNALIITDACTLLGGTLPTWADFRSFLQNDIGFSAKKIKVVTIHESPTAVELLNDVDLIVVTGGNVFKLRYALFQKEGVVDAIRDAVSSGVVYASQSAGSVIAGESIGWTHQKNADSKGKIDNPPNDWPDFDDPENWNALALIDKSIFVHFKEEDHKTVMDVGKLKPNGNTFILPDPQTLFVSDGFMKILK